MTPADQARAELLAAVYAKDETRAYDAVDVLLSLDWPEVEEAFDPTSHPL